jgi:hypothetical protein
MHMRSRNSEALALSACVSSSLLNGILRRCEAKKKSKHQLVISSVMSHLVEVPRNHAHCLQLQRRTMGQGW